MNIRSDRRTRVVLRANAPSKAAVDLAVDP
jgi:hypothetical protein